MGAKLPKWLMQREDGAFVVDPDIAYPLVMKALGIKDIDQYAVETAYQCTKLAVQDMILGSDLDPRPKGMGLTIVINSAGQRKERWALSAFQPGRGVGAATKGLEAKQNYARIAATMRA